MKKVLAGVVLLALLNNPLAFSQNRQQLTLATTAWCPYTCSYQKYEFGVVGHYITHLLAQHGIVVKITSYPWSRALNLANSGEVDGLLTAIKSEAPNLLLTETAITDYRVCFFTRTDDNWQFTNPLSLPGKTFGVIQDYGYGEPIDSFVTQSYSGAKIVQISGSDGAKRLIDMLQSKRIDLFVGDDKVIAWHLTENNMSPELIRNAGCLAAQPFYLALYPNDANKELIKLLNQLLANKENQLSLQQLFE